MTNNAIFPSNSRANRFLKKLSFCFGNTRYRVHQLHRRFFAIELGINLRAIHLA